MMIIHTPDVQKHFRVRLKGGSCFSDMIRVDTDSYGMNNDGKWKPPPRVCPSLIDVRPSLIDRRSIFNAYLCINTTE